MNFKKCTFEKIAFKVFGGYKDEKNSYLSTAYNNLAEIWLWNVWSIHVLILQSSSTSVEHSANFEKCTYEKIAFKVFGGYKDKKNHISPLPIPVGWNLAVGCLKYTCINLAKFIKICWTECNIPPINLAAAAFQKHSFLQIFYPIQPNFGAADSFFTGGRWN